jgi:hypothetical protein
VIRLRSVKTNYHVLRSTFSASRALQVLAFTFSSGFDSHTLPPVLRRGLLRTSLVAEGGLSADFWHSPDRELHLC